MASVANHSAPNASVVPILVYEVVGKALEFLTRAFGFKELRCVVENWNKRRPNPVRPK